MACGDSVRAGGRHCSNCRACADDGGPVAGAARQTDAGAAGNAAAVERVRQPAVTLAAGFLAVGF